MEIDYRNLVVKKPWGHEYLVYENENLGVWYLNILPGESTSLHCHPKKNTGFVVLDGSVNLKFLRGEMSLTAPDKVHIFRGRFHSSTCTSSSPAHILEIEVPQDKHDLVRLEDNYGRSKKPYEGEKHHLTRDDSHLWITDQAGISYDFNHCTLQILEVSKQDLTCVNSDSILIFLRGGLYHDDNTGDILQPGDVVTDDIMRLLAGKFSVRDRTTVLMVTKNESHI